MFFFRSGSQSYGATEGLPAPLFSIDPWRIENYNRQIAKLARHDSPEVFEVATQRRVLHALDVEWRIEFIQDIMFNTSK